jgi:TonB-dependent SusC/RagA subfamily outer membrane receptor
MKKLLIIFSCFAVCAAAAAQDFKANTVTAADLETANTFNPSNSLYGLLPGLSVIQTGSVPWDDAASLTVRGLGSFNGNNILIVIDGVPGRDLSLLNVGEIEKITVLKDAASLALYGNRGADGALLITTRRGVQEGLKISLDYNYSLQTPFRMPEMADNHEYASAVN